MKFSYSYSTIDESRANKIYYLLVENFFKTFFVGGTVRDMLLHKKLTDFDIATEGLPENIIEIAKNNQLKVDARGAKFGVINLVLNNTKVEVATLRKELGSDSRYPEVKFINSTKIDSQRRDFTVNSLYFQAKTSQILDYHGGVKDIKAGMIRFIGNPSKRIQEDPLRVIRAYRFQLDLGFKFESRTQQALEQHSKLIQKISRSRIEKEVLKLRAKQMQHKLRTIINKMT